MGKNSILFQCWLVFIVKVAEHHSHYLVLMIINVITEIYFTIKTVTITRKLVINSYTNT